jgi:secondary thiamine-phosphate synthase enzyme
VASTKASQKQSTATVRAQPVEDAGGVYGQLKLRAESFTVNTHNRIDVIDLTDHVMEVVRTYHIREGTLTVFSMHTTCTLFVNEYQAALVADMRRFLEHIVPSDAAWLHNDPDHSDCDRQNADAHLRAMLLGHSVTLQVSGGEVVLGQWQRILMGELDGPRTRQIRLSVMGVA